MIGSNLLIQSLGLNFAFTSPNKQIETGFIPLYVKVVGTADLKSYSMNAKVASKKILKRTTIFRVRSLM